MYQQLYASRMVSDAGRCGPSSRPPSSFSSLTPTTNPRTHMSRSLLAFLVASPFLSRRCVPHPPPTRPTQVREKDEEIALKRIAEVGPWESASEGNGGRGPYRVRCNVLFAFSVISLSSF